MTALTLGDYAALTGILGTPLTVGILLLNSIRGQVKATSDKLTNMDQRLETLERDRVDRSTHRDLVDRVADMEKSKAERIDWLRDSVSTREKIDMVAENVANISGKLDALYGISAAAVRIEAAIREHGKVRDGGA